MSCTCCTKAFCFRPQLQFESRQKVLPKYGHPDFSQEPDEFVPEAPGTSVPRRYYLTRTDAYNGEGEWDMNRVSTINPLTNALTVVGDGAPVAVPQGYVDAWSFTSFAGHYGSEAGTDPGDIPFTADLADENTTANVIALARANIPAFSLLPETDFNNQTSPSAALIIASGETSVTARRFRYRWRIAPSAGCYMKLTWIERFTPADEEEEPVDTPRATEWVGEGTPCFPEDFPWQDLFSSEAPFTPGGNTTYTFIGDADDLLPPTVGPDCYEVDVPETPGVTTIEELRWTCVRGAEPTRPIYEDGVAQEDLAPNILGDEP